MANHNNNREEDPESKRSSNCITVEGDSWLICDSKSRGIKYYYHPKTRESVWVLSDAEVKKAKQCMNSNPPEPKQSPKERSTSPQSNALIAYNKTGPRSYPINTYPSSSYEHTIWERPPPQVVPPSIYIIPYPVPSTSDQPQINFHNYSQRNNDGCNYSSNNDLRNRIYNPNNIHYNSGSKKFYNRKKWPNKARDFEENKYETVSSLKMDLSTIKKLAREPIQNSDTWYIMVDYDVLVQYFKYLININDSDKQCRLFIPNVVKEELDHISSSDHLVKRISRFLTESDNVIKEEKSAVSDISKADAIFKSYLNLFRSHHVVLFSNDPDILELKKNSTGFIFSLEEFEEILMNRELDARGASPASPASPDRDPRDERAKSLNTEKLLLALASDYFNSKLESEDNVDEDDRESVPEPKVPMPMLSIKVERSETAEDDPDRPPDDAPGARRATVDGGRLGAPPGTTGKRRKIKLNRSISAPKDIEPAAGKKPTRWRRRIVAASASDNPSGQNSVDGSETDPNVPSQSDSGSVADGNAGTRLMESSKPARSAPSGPPPAAPPAASPAALQFAPPAVPLVRECRDVLQQITFADLDSVAEDNLRRKSDEWVSRFKETMEEMLRVVLEEEPAFRSRDFPAPWSLHEAALCVIQKFFRFSKIVESANNLSDRMSKSSDDKGNLIVDMKPEDFMNIYKCGVRLVASLQSVTKKEDDLFTAISNLKRLGDDIRNPNLDYSDTFVDGPNEVAEDVVENIPNEESVTAAEIVSLSPRSESESEKQMRTNTCTYNLRSKRSLSPEQEPALEKIKKKKIENTENFFLNLGLKKTIVPSELPSTTISFSSRDPPNEDGTQVTDHLHLNGDQDGKAKQPVIIRNVAKPLKAFEEKLMSNRNARISDNTNDCSSAYGDFDYSECGSDLNTDRPAGAERARETGRVEGDSAIETADAASDGNERFKMFIYTFSKEIKETFFGIQSVCEKYVTRLRDPELSTAGRRDILHEAKNMATHMDNLSESLSSIFVRDNESEEDTGCLLKNSEIGSVASPLLSVYRHIVCKYIEQAKMLKVCTQRIALEAEM